MAIVKQNGITSTFRGKIGNVVFRGLGTKTIVSEAPYTNLPPTELQDQFQRRFGQAARWAQKILMNPGYREQYEALARARRPGSAFNMAMSDYLNAPDIASIDATGSVVHLVAFDDAGVVSVNVQLVTPQGNTVETGFAVRGEGPPLFATWTYALRHPLPYPPGTRVVVTAKDLPGNQAEAACALGETRSGNVMENEI